MKITMLAIGSTGDVNPYILLGKELKKRGHDVIIAAFSKFSSIIQNAGIGFFPLNGDAESFISSIMDPSTNAFSYLPRLYHNLKSTVPLLIQDIEKSCLKSDAMICNFFGTVYYSISEKLDIPCIQTHYFPMDPTGDTPISSVRNQQLPRSLNRFSYKAGYLLISIVENRLLSDWRRKNDLMLRKATTHPVYNTANHNIPVIYAISPSVFQRPSEWPSSIKMSGFWIDDEISDWIPSETLSSFLSAGPAPLYIGFGSMNTGDMNCLFSSILHALHKTGIRAVICGGWAAQNIPSDEQICFETYIPHSWIFPKVKAVVHHGGAGTTAAGLRWGKPTLIIPFSGDQFFWGSQIYKNGCGPKPISRKHLNSRSLTDSLSDLYTNMKYYKSAQTISSNLAKEHGISTAADIIENELYHW